MYNSLGQEWTLGKLRGNQHGREPGSWGEQAEMTLERQTGIVHQEDLTCMDVVLEVTGSGWHSNTTSVILHYHVESGCKIKDIELQAMVEENSHKEDRKDRGKSIYMPRRYMCIDTQLGHVGQVLTVLLQLFCIQCMFLSLLGKCDCC